MNRRIHYFFYLFFIIPAILNAQVGGDNVYEFLNLSPSARITALGGSLITVVDDDAALGFHNPAALNPTMHQQLSFNHNLHFSGIHNGYASYAHHLKKWDATLHTGIQYITYGSFDATDEFGTINGSFKASEYAITAGVGKQFSERIRFGANLKLVTSQLESYNSLGLTTDLAAVYHDTARSFTASLVFKNIGAQLTAYDNGNREPLPFDIQIGISKKLSYLPFRLSITFHNLQRWNILYDDPNAEETTLFLGDVIEENGNANQWLDNLLRHFIFGGEFMFGKKDNFRMRFGYNHFRRKELSLDDFRSLAGISLGLGLKIKRFRIEIGRAFWHIAGGVNHFSLATNLSEF